MNGTLYAMEIVLRMERIRILFGSLHLLISVLDHCILATALHIVDIATVKHLQNICLTFAIVSIVIARLVTSLCVSIHSNTFECRLAIIASKIHNSDYEMIGYYYLSMDYY